MNQAIIKANNKKTWIVVSEYKFHSITVPKNFISNGANIPRPFWSFFAPHSPEYISAAIMHDYLCLQAHKHNSYEESKRADKVFALLLKKLGVAKYKISLFYSFVRLHHFLKYKVFR